MNWNAKGFFFLYYHSNETVPGGRGKVVFFLKKAFNTIWFVTTLKLTELYNLNFGNGCYLAQHLSNFNMHMNHLGIFEIQILI